MIDVWSIWPKVVNLVPEFSAFDKINHEHSCHDTSYQGVMFRYLLRDMLSGELNFGFSFEIQHNSNWSALTLFNSLLRIDKIFMAFQSVQN